MSEENKLGLLHIYCGNGKGKTTAAIGLSVRAAGSGLNVLFAQFLKSWSTGELSILEKQDNIIVVRSDEPLPFTNKMDEAQKQRVIQIHNRLFNDVQRICAENEIHLLILDEIIATYNYKLIDLDLVDNFLATRDKKMEVVLTGREPSEAFMAMADYVTEMKKIKHPYDVGIKSRKGIEF